MYEQDIQYSFVVRINILNWSKHDNKPCVRTLKEDYGYLKRNLKRKLKRKLN